MIRFKCIYCGQRILARDDGIGKKGKCPKCRHELRVPKTTIGRPAIRSDIPEKLQQAKEALALLTQLSQIGIKIGGFDSASGVSFHHKTYHLAGSYISSAAAVSANPS